MTNEPEKSFNKIQTVLVCYTQSSFEQLEKRSDDVEEVPDEEVERNRYLATLAEGLTAALQASGRTAEIVRLPQRSYKPVDISKAAFAWRIIDLKESNGQPIDLLICLDFPAWSVQHPQKWVWLTALPNFVIRARNGPSRTGLDLPEGDNPASKVIRLQRNDQQAENAKAISGLLQAERRGLAEAQRLLAGSRPVAEDLARRGLQVEFQPLPPDPAIPPNDPQWQTALDRLFRNAKF